MEVFLPRSLDEALELKTENPDAVPVAGGTDLMVAINFGRARPPALLDLSRVAELKAWHTENGRVHLGAGVTFATIERELTGFRPLAEAARSVGSPQIRNRATIGGNVGTASPAGDGLLPLAAYDAEVVVASRDRIRRESWETFFVGPKRTTLAPDELIVGLEWRRIDAPGSFAKVGTRNAMVIAIAGLCVQLDPPARTVRVALGSVAPTVVRAREAEAFAAGAVHWDRDAPFDDAVVAEFGSLVSAAATPIDDVRGSAMYRRHAVEVLARRALRWVFEDWERAR
jgi:CO/xanthine dehydrogenase FAD-binding subunit